MTPESVIDVGYDAIHVTMLLAAPLLLSALAIGLTIGVFQAATQIQEMTLSFIPKLIAMAIAGMIAGPWMLNVLLTFTLNLYASIPEITG